MLKLNSFRESEKLDMFEAFINKYPKGLCPEEIVKKTNFPTQTVKKYMNKLVKKRRAVSFEIGSEDYKIIIYAPTKNKLVGFVR